MAAAKRDRRRTDIAKFLDAYRELSAPQASPAEQAIWVILARHGSKESANRAFKALWRRYVSVNELRVAKPLEIAEIIKRNVRNDAVAVARQLRGFLRRFFVEFQGVDLAAADGRTVEGLKKFISHLPEFRQDVALALALHHCQVELQVQAEYEAAQEEARPRKRPEKEITAAAKRLRMLFTFASHGGPTCKSKLVTCSRCMGRAWAYAPLPEPEPAAPARRKTAGGSRGAGKAVPRRTRAVRTRKSTKKSSRR